MNQDQEDHLVYLVSPVLLDLLDLRGRLEVVVQQEIKDHKDLQAR